MTLIEIVVAGVVLILSLGAALVLIKKLVPSGAARGTESSLQLLQQQMEGLRGQLQDSIRGMSAEVNTRLNQLNDSVAQRLAENVAAVQSSGRQVGDGVNRALNAVGEVRQQLGKLEEASVRIFDVGKDIAALQDLLRAPQFRGGLGEYLLEELLAQMFPKNFFAMQYTFESGERVDAVLCVGEGRIPIDSKFPMESFSRAVEANRAGSESEARLAQRRFRAEIKKHIDEIARKYVRPKENFYDFALMYVPAENVYYETIIRDEGRRDEGGLFEYAISRRVIPLSPNTLFAYLQVIVMGLRGLKVEESAKKILSGLGQLQKELEKMHESFDKVGTQLQYARNNYDEARRRLTDFSRQLTVLSDLSDSGEPQPVLTTPEEED